MTMARPAADYESSGVTSSDLMSLLETVAWAILAGGAASLILCIGRQLATISGKGKVFQQELKLLEEQIMAVRDSRRLQKESSAPWNGTRKFRVARKEKEIGPVYSFYLSPHDGKLPLPKFLPGQFLTFHLNIDDKSETRCYSLSDSPRPDLYRVTIKRCPPPRDNPDAPPGLVSSHFHDVIEEGDILDVSAPQGAFTIDLTEETPLVLSGAGIGVTPVLSMMKSLMEDTPRREIYFYYGIRDTSENLIADEIAEWRSRDLPNLHVFVCMCDPLPEDIENETFDHKGFVTVDLFKKHLPSNNFDFFTCGPGPMMESIRNGLTEWGVPDSRVHDEAFLAAKKEVEVGEATINFKKSGKTVKLSGSSTSLLDIAEEEGVCIPSGCRSGGCGSCKTAILSGQVRYESPPKIHVEAGSCLPCVCLPEGDLVLDT